MTSSDASWSSDWTLARGILAYPKENNFGFRLRPQEGTLEADTQRFLLHDMKLSSGPASGRLAVTYLSTRSLTLIPSTSLTSEITASSTDFDVASAAPLNPAGGYCWIDNECIKYDAPVGTTVPIATDGRGAFGSLPRDHRAYGGLYPEVWAAFPFLDRRRVVLWRVSRTTATPHWRGYIQTSARTSTGAMAAGYEIQCMHVWAWQQVLTLGIIEASPRLRGIDNMSVRGIVRNSAPDERYWIDTWFTSEPARLVWNTRTEAATAIFNNLRGQLPTPSGADYIRILSGTSTRGSIRLSVRFNGDYADECSAAIAVGAEETSVAAAPNPNGGKVAVVSAAVPVVARTFKVTEQGQLSALPQTVELDDVSDLPSTWTYVYTIEGNYTTMVQPVLRAALNDDAWLVVYPTGKTNNPPSVDGCGMSVVARRSNAYDRDATGFVNIRGARLDGNGGTQGSAIAGLFIAEPLQFSLCYQLATQHWVFGLRYGVVGDRDFDGQTPLTNPPDYLASGADYRDWEWSNTADIVRATAGAPNAQTLYLDGKVTLGQLITDTALYNGCVVSEYNSQLRLVTIRPPMPTDTVVASLTKADWVRAPEWIPMPEVLANSVKMEADNGTLIVNDQRSQQRYGKGRELAARMHGIDNLAELGVSPTTLSQSLFKRVLGLWGDPVAAARLIVTRSRVGTVHLGDYVRITSDWFLPDQQGGRGFTVGSAFSQRAQGVGQVIGIEESLKEGTLMLELLFFALDGFAGYSPACKINSITGAQLFMSRSFLTAASSTKNYDGSDPSMGDAGVSRFRVGDRVRFIERNTFTPAIGSGYIIQSIDPTTQSITLTTTPPGWGATVAGGAWVDLVYDLSTASGLQDNQRGYAWIGDEATNAIAGTNDPAQRWSP